MSALWRVRVLTRNREFAPYSPDLTRDEAIAEQERLEAAIVPVRDGPSFVDFIRSSGQPVKIRARDVVAIEILPPARYRTATTTGQPFVDEVPAPAPAPVPPSAELVAARERLRPAAAGPGTQFLQSLEGQRQPQPTRRRGGTR